MARYASSVISAMRSGSGAPALRQISGASRQPPKRSRRSVRRCRSALSVASPKGGAFGMSAIAASEILNAALHVAIPAAGEIARSSAANAPDEGAILGIELLHALVGLDYLRPADAHTGVLGNNDLAATGGSDATATEGSGATADQGEDRDADAAHFDDGIDNLGDREFAGIRLLKTDAARVEQQQHSMDPAPSGVARGSQQTEELCAMHLAEGAPQESALLRGNEDVLAVETAAAYHDAVVEGACEIELGEVRAHGALFGPEELDEALRVEQSGDAIAGGGFVPIRLVGLQQVAHASGSISRALCISRKVTVSGRAPPSLMEKRRPPGELRSKNS